MSDKFKKESSMAESSSTISNYHHRQRQGLPVPIHPDDAKDKVFTAILKALLKMGNKPSSPKELANVIVKYKYATLGGATPFATVSSRISQHFKRAAQHNPPRPPLLARHFDENHSRKINYSLATEPPGSSATPPQSSPTPVLSDSSEDESTATIIAANDVAATTTAAIEVDSAQHDNKDPDSQHFSPTARGSPPLTRASRRRTRRQRHDDNAEDEYDEDDDIVGQNDADDEGDHSGSASSSRRGAKRMRRHQPDASHSAITGTLSSHTFPSYSPSPPLMGAKVKSAPSHAIPPVSPPSTAQMDMEDIEEDDESEAEYSDYHEEMLKGDEALAAADHENHTHRRPSIPMVGSRRPSIAQATASSQSVDRSPWLSARRQSFSLINQSDDIWNPYDNDFDQVFLSDETTSHSFPLNIATPESISMAELETYFNSGDFPTGAAAAAAAASLPSFNNDRNPLSTSSSTHPSSARTSSRKSFSALMGSRETSLLQRALLASTARGMTGSTSTAVGSRALTPAAAAASTAAAAAFQSTTEAHTAMTERTAMSNVDRQEQLEEDVLNVRPRRKSWPDEGTTSGAHLFSDEEEEDRKSPESTATAVETSERASIDAEALATKTTTTANTVTSNEQSVSPLEKRREPDFSIYKKTLGALECYQLDSPKDIPDTKILRFIASTDGATEHVALRTRHAADTARERRNSQHFYLDEGYVNATQLRKAARLVLGKGTFDASGETEEGRVVVSLTKGPLECRGAWVPLSRARELIKEFGIDHFPGLSKLLSDDPLEDQYGNTIQASDQKDESHVTTIAAVAAKEVPTTTAVAKTPLSTSEPAQVELKDTDAMMHVDDAESFVKFEEDDEKKPGESEALKSMPGQTSIAIDSNAKGNHDVSSLAAPQAASSLAVAAAAPPQQPASSAPLDLSKTFNLTALQQMAAAIPGFDFNKALNAYMQSVTKATSQASSSSLPSSQPAPPSAADIKAALARFPALEALLRKDPTSPTPPPPPVPLQAIPAAIVNTETQQPVIHPLAPTNPPMFITVADNVAVCVAVLAPTDSAPEYRIMRRLDIDYINGTSLLTAGGIDTDSERSMILSFELERRRIPEKKSQLYGTWISLRRAQELAVTCSIQHRLGPFLHDSIESYFPSPLPIPIQRRPVIPPPAKDMRLGSLALRALRNGGSTNKYMLARPLSPPSQTTSAAQLHQLLLNSNPRKMAEYAQKAPLLGTFEDEDPDDKRIIAVIDKSIARSSSGTSVAASLPRKQRHSQKMDDASSDVDIENSGSEDDETPGDEQEEDTDTDTDVEEVRKRMKKMRDAAIDAMESGSSIDLEELLRRASSPIVERPVVRPSDALRRTATVRASSGRRRPQGRAITSGGKIAPSALKKSASWSGSLTTPPLRVVLPTNNGGSSSSSSTTSTSTSTSKKNQSNRKTPLRPSKLRNHHENNRVVEHTAPPPSSSSSSSSSSPASSHNSISVPASNPQLIVPPPGTTSGTSIASNIAPAGSEILPTIQEDDEDEEIDIGGSDRDDDLR